MASEIFDKFWHGTLQRPYKLARPVDQGSGDSVVLLHGIGRTAGVWQNVIAELRGNGLRVTALDLLGFGNSPKPSRLSYSTDDHSQAVIATIERLRLNKPMVIVGHSMGCLVAVRVARLRPDLVKRLVLYEMPLYEGLPHKRSYRLRADLYLRLYRRIIKMKPTFSAEKARMVERLARKIAGQEVTAATWQPFIRSLENTIMRQTTAKDIKELNMPIDVIYGRFDMFVIRGKAQQMFGVDSGHIITHTVRASHVISPRASKFLVSRILAAAEAEE